MNDSLKLLLAAGVSLAAGYLLGANPGKSFGDSTANANGQFLLSAANTGLFLTNTRTGQVWALSSPNSAIDASTYRWNEIPMPSPRQ